MPIDICCFSTKHTVLVSIRLVDSVSGLSEYKTS
jgi:hypothetical protein